MTDVSCRACGSTVGTLVLDLGVQPACDDFPPAADPGPDDTYPLRMWLCGDCGLAQLAEDATVPAEPKAVEPAALVEQAVDAVARVAAAGWLDGRRTVAEYGSPHGGSWLGLLRDRGLVVAGPAERADVVLDCFGMMHEPDQAAAVGERAQRVAPGGVLLLQYHSLATIVDRGQWNSLRHGHYAYYSATTLARLLERAGFVLRAAWAFDLYGGTVLLAATRAGGPEESVTRLLDDERRARITEADAVAPLQEMASSQARRLAGWLTEQQRQRRSVLGYGAASRAIALLGTAGIGATLLPAIADAAPAKQGRRIPGTDIRVIGPADLVAAAPDRVLLLLPDLLAEVRQALPEIELAGGRWVDIETLVGPPGGG